MTFLRVQSTTFLVISGMTRDVLTTPVFTVVSEQVFSYSGRVLEEWRTRLNEDILEALMCVKDCEDVHCRDQQFADDMLAYFFNLDIFLSFLYTWEEHCVMFKECTFIFNFSLYLFFLFIIWCVMLNFWCYFSSCIYVIFIPFGLYSSSVAS